MKTLLNKVERVDAMHIVKDKRGRCYPLLIDSKGTRWIPYWEDDGNGLLEWVSEKLF